MRNFVFRVLLLLLALLFTLGVAEVFMRVLGPQVRAHRPSVMDRPQLDFYPGDSRLHAWSRGAKDALRVAVVGDSITAGTGVQFYDAYPWRLELLLNLNDGVRPAVVDVWAKGGMNTEQEAKHLLKKALAWKPDVLILGMCLNDAENQGQAEELNRWRDEMVPRAPPPWLADILRRTRVGSWIYQKAEDLRANRGFLKYYRQLYSTDYSGWKKMERAIGTFNESCREANVPLVVVIFPLMSNVDRYPFEFAHRQIGGVLEREGVRHLDLLRVFQGLSPVRLQAIPNVDAHPSEIGQRIAAEAIFQYLLANGLVDKSYTPQQVRGSPQRMWGILRSFVQNAAGADRALRERLKSEFETNLVTEGGAP